MIDSMRIEKLHNLQARHKGLTAKRLAALLGVSPVTVSRWVQGHNPMPQAVAVAIDAMQRLPIPQFLDLINQYRR